MLIFTSWIADSMHEIHYEYNYTHICRNDERWSKLLRCRVFHFMTWCYQDVVQMFMVVGYWAEFQIFVAYRVSAIFCGRSSWWGEVVNFYGNFPLIKLSDETNRWNSKLSPHSEDFVVSRVNVAIWLLDQWEIVIKN